MALTRQDYLQRSLDLAVRPAIRNLDVDWLRALVEMGVEINVKDNQIGGLISSCAYLSRIGEPIDYRKHIRMLDYLLDLGFKIPFIDGSLYCSVRGARYDFFLVLEFVLHQGAEIDSNLIMKNSPIDVLSMYIRKTQTILHTTKFDKRRFKEKLQMPSYFGNYPPVCVKLYLCSNYPKNCAMITTYCEDFCKYYDLRIIENSFFIDMMIEVIIF